ncbi:glycosyltransferase [Saccharothrix longispora]|uniref:glycosyltransferase n=1 Tax=Saccharothrix longispora TaxID=33920 RepID=UPI0028FD586E|nr:glycosyltransferase [Saccharothrix longispora]MBY8848062.1 glycosyltransferase [Saccharothrix sp. MB29]MDU0289169.1 glycosyltransferase [Saccharothrix longispora]
MKILLWHVHGSWTNAFVQGGHEYLIAAPPKGIGLAGRDWPAAREVDVAGAEADVAVIQRPEEIGWVPSGIPLVYLEHNTPKHPNQVHPLKDWPGTIVHVTHFNDLMWDCGDTRTAVIEHGVVDPGHRYTGELARAAVVVNEPVRRGRVVGTDLLPRFAEVAPLDVYGMGTEKLGDMGRGDHDLDSLHRELARRRAYVHPVRWTSLGLSLIEAMHLGMPVVALACTEVVRAVPPDAGVVSTDVDELVRGLRDLVADPALAVQRGKQAREFALAHYGLDAFLRAWDRLLTGVSG